MPRLRGHLRISRRFLGLKGNANVHHLLDGAGLAKSLQPQYHRLTHHYKYIEETISPLLGREGELEAWGHLLADWGFLD